ncbi:MAG: hypothetical protein WAP08_01955 [Smithellaceae bacterium]|jgi:hypothetical protein|nr:hypothetical protein [Syntrophaceae bacterium]
MKTGHRDNHTKPHFIVLCELTDAALEPFAMDESGSDGIDPDPRAQCAGKFIKKLFK